jgi:hypothetical protein
MAYKDKAIAKSFPFRIRLLNQNSFSWTVADDFSSLQITAFTLPSSLVSDEFSTLRLGLYAWDASQEAYDDYALHELSTPLVLDLRASGFVDFTSRPYFKLVIYDTTTKKYLYSSRKLLLGNEDFQSSILPMYPKKLGKRIAQLVITEEEGPTLYVSCDFSTANGVIPFVYLRRLLVDDPQLASGIWPVLLDQIVTESYRFRANNEWARTWLKYVSSFVSGSFNGDLLSLDEGDVGLEEVILEFVEKWIAHHNYDTRFYDEKFSPAV